MIDILNTMALTTDEVHQEIEFLIPKFLPKGLITMYYADGGNGKTWLSYSVAAYLCKNNLAKAVYYLDLDNSLVSLKERKTDELLIERYRHLKYIHRSKINKAPIELLEDLARDGRSKLCNYEDIVLILDSLRDFTDIKNDQKALYMMSLLKDIREAGATVLCIAHSNKDGKNYEGSNNIKNSVDVMFKLTQLQRVMGEYLILGLEAQKERAGVENCDFKIDTNNLDFSSADPVYSKMNEYEENFVNKAKEVLKKNPDGLNKTKLLEALGYKKDDKTARDTLEKFVDKFWKETKVSNRCTYTAI